VADETATFALDLEGLSDIAGLAERSATALEELRGRIKADQAELANMGAAMRAVKGDGAGLAAASQQLKERQAALKDRVAQSQAAYIRLGGSFKKTDTASDTSAKRLAELAKVAQGMRGPLGTITQKITALRGALAGGLIAVGVLAAAAAFVAFGAAVGVAVVALVRFGVAQADARRNEKLQLEGLTRARNWYGIAAGKAEDLQAAIDKVSDSSSLGRDQINGMASSLYKANLRGAALTQALEAVATATAGGGEGQGALYTQLAIGAGRYGGSLKRVADDAKARFGGVVRAQMLSLDVQSKKLRENMGRIFGGLKIDGLLKGISEVLNLFSQTTASGRALKTLAETMLNPLLTAIEAVGPIAKRFFQGLVIGALLVTIGLQRVRNWWLKTFGDSEILKGMNLQHGAVIAGILVVGALAAMVLGLAAAMGLLAVAVVVASLPFIAFAKVVGDAYSAIENKDWKALGIAIARGVAAGVTLGASEAILAITRMGADMAKAFKNKLKIASPSGVFKAEAKWIPEGVIQPIKSSAPRVRAAVEAMVRVPRMGLKAGAVMPEIPMPAAPGAAAAPGREVRIEIAHIEIKTAATDAKAIARDFREELIRELEDAASGLGVMVT
jgi:hypothetical protein